MIYLFSLGLIFVALLNYAVLLDPRTTPPLFLARATIKNLLINKLLFIDYFNKKRKVKIVLDYYRAIPVLLFVSLALISLLLAITDLINNGQISQFIGEKTFKIIFLSLTCSDLVYEVIIKLIWYSFRKKMIVDKKHEEIVKILIQNNSLSVIEIIAISLSFLSFLITFSLAFLYGDFDIFGFLGLFSFLWLCAISIPFAIFSLILGIKKKRKFHIYSSSIFICLSISLSCCSFYRLHIDYTNSIVDSIEQKSSINLPDSLKVMSISKNDYNLGYAKILHDTEKISFEADIFASDSFWQSSLPSKIKNILDKQIVKEIINFDSFVFYDYTTNLEFNKLSTISGDYLSIFVAYDSSKNKIVLVDKLLYSIV